MLGARYRFAVYNTTGASTGGAGTVTVRVLRWYINTTGVPTWEGSGTTPTTVYSNTGAITTTTFDTAGATAQNNSGAANPFIGAEVEFVVNIPSGSPSGSVTLFLQRSVDGGTTWPSNGYGEAVAALFFSGAGTLTTVFEYD